MSDDKSIGAKFEDFTILKVLSRGKYGYVAKVKSKRDNNIYAMKKIDLNLIKSEKAEKYYENEFNIADSLNHENVYRALSKFKEKSVQYIITEYMDGGNLLELFNWHKEIKENKDKKDKKENKENEIKIDEKKLLNIFVQCLRGLKYIHEKGIIHRSIKHDNIIFDSNDKIKIINFKYSIQKEENDRELIDISTLTAPEMKKYQGYDEKVDVYSMGMIFSSLVYLSTKSKPKEEDYYSKRIYNSIDKMKNEKDNRPSSSEIYLDFANMYYDAIKAYLTCLIFYFSDNFKKQKKELLKLETRGMADTSIAKKIIDLSKINDYKSEESISIIEKFRENGLDISKINPKKFIEYILNVMNDEIKLDKNKNEFETINPKDTNETKKKNFEMNYKKYIKKNKTLISDNFLVSYIKTEECKNCAKEKNKYYIYKNSFKIDINKEILDEANSKFNKAPNNKENGIIKYVFNVLNEKIKTEKAKICGGCVDKNIGIACKKSTTKFYELSKYLIFLCDPEIEFNDEDKENLSKFKIGKEEVECIENDCTYEYKLISIIIKSEDGYDYYNRKPKENMFSKNDGETKGDNSNMYDLNEMSGKLVALFYYSELKNEGSNINNITISTDNSSNNNNNNILYPSQSDQRSIKINITNEIIISYNNISGNQSESRSGSSNIINNYPNSNHNFNNYINNNTQQNNNIQLNGQNPNIACNNINNNNENQIKKDESMQDNNNLINSINFNREGNDVN